MLFYEVGGSFLIRSGDFQSRGLLLASRSSRPCSLARFARSVAAGELGAARRKSKE